MQTLFAIGVAPENICVRGDDKPSMDLEAFDVAFFKSGWNGWYGRLPEPLAASAIDLLAHRVTKQPKDLLSHVHRIVALYYTNDTALIYGALLDLFIVLDKKGFRLRQRLLNKLASKLGADHRVVLRNGLLFGICAVEDVPLSVSSCFSAELHNMGAVVVQTGEQITHEFSVLDEALDLIDSGFLDEARMILEEAILTTPDDLELNNELLNLFRCTKDRDAFFSAVERFSELSLAAKDSWIELKDRFLEGEGV